MKKGLLITSLILLVATLAAMGVGHEEYLRLIIIGTVGTGLLGAAYPAY